MSPSFGTGNKIKFQPPKYVGELRKSKITTTAGCGALVDFPGYSGIMEGINRWTIGNENELKIHERSLEEYLGVEYFIQVASEEEKKNFSKGYTIPVRRFPEYCHCPKCRELDYARKIAKNYKHDKDQIQPLICSRCGVTELIPSRFIIGCKNGHISEFPYTWWAHRGTSCEKPVLKLEYEGKSGGLDSIVVVCKTCGSRRSMKNCLSEGVMEHFPCKGEKPWLGKDAKCDCCDQPVRVLLRGASNVYYPEVVSALTVPPWSNDIQKLIENNYDLFKGYFVEGIPDAVRDTLIMAGITNCGILKKAKCSMEEAIKQVRLRFQKNSEQPVTPKSIMVDEYRAFSGPDKNDIYFKTESVDVPYDLKKYISQVKLVKRLRAVQVLYGFRRISAFSDEGSSLAPISNKKERWFPATELLGEGIFIEFSRKQIEEWKHENTGKYDKMHERYNASKMSVQMGEFSPELVMIHTFSHLLMRELSYNCGYDSAAIKEKLYVGEIDDCEMAGLLIYTTTTCSDGSLGGLVRQGMPERLEKNIYEMLRKAEWCSNDPICIEAESQGVDSLNYAACHACTHVPEVGCVGNNKVLDRYSIVGDVDNREKGYLGELMV